MTEKPSVLIRLDAYLCANWTFSEAPVAILNIESTLHDRISYCWGLANQLYVLSNFLCEHDNTEIRQVAALFGCQLQPLKVILQKLVLRQFHGDFFLVAGKSSFSKLARTV